MSDTLDVSALGVLVRQLQQDVHALGIKLDLLARGRERDVAAFGTRDDMLDVVDLLADFDQRISSMVRQLVEQMESHGKMLAEILERLPPQVKGNG
jgi:hypothetical protein